MRLIAALLLATVFVPSALAQAPPATVTITIPTFAAQPVIDGLQLYVQAIKDSIVKQVNDQLHPPAPPAEEKTE